MSEQEQPPEQPSGDSQPETLFIQHFCEEARPLSYYLKNMSGYSALKKALGMSTDEVINEVKKAHIRGRGGAGFPAGVKWSLIPKESAKAKYFICNADESEPGTFKDRDLMRYTPHLVLEGMAIGAYAIGAHVGYIYIRGEYVGEAGILQAAILEAEKAGYLGKNIMGTGFDFEITIHRGAGAYICGEETALLTHSRAGAASRGSNRRTPQSRGLSADPLSSIMSKRLPGFPSSSTAEEIGTQNSAASPIPAARGFMKCRDT